MKKIKYLAPILGVCASMATVMPVVTACNKTEDEPQSVIKYVPTELLKIEANTLKGLKDGADITQYNAIEIPTDVYGVADGAFAVSENTNAVDYSTIKYLKVHNTLREVGFKCFAGLTALQEFDLSELGSFEINVLCNNLDAKIELIGSGFSKDYLPFGNPKDIAGRHCYIKFNENIDKDEMENIYDKFEYMVPNSWFVKLSADEVSIISGKESLGLEKGYNKDAVPYLQLTNLLGDQYELTFDIEVLSKGANVKSFRFYNNYEYDETNKIVSIDDESLYMTMDGEYDKKFDNQSVKFNLIVTAMEIDSTTGYSKHVPFWVQKIEGLEVYYAYTHVTSIESIDNVDGWVYGNSFDLFGTNPETQKPYTVVLPENATNKELDFSPKSSENDYIEVSDEGTIKFIGTNNGTGSATVTIKSKDVETVAKTVNATVNGYWIGLESQDVFATNTFDIKQSSKEFTIRFKTDLKGPTTGCANLYEAEDRNFQINVNSDIQKIKAVTIIYDGQPIAAEKVVVDGTGKFFTLKNTAGALEADKSIEFVVTCDANESDLNGVSFNFINQ